MGKKLLGWLLLAFVVFFVLRNPSGAAATARHIGAALAAAGTHLGEFVSAVTGGAHR